ncbi:MAG: hypothetical protein JSV78_11440 [Phycisphaerales bacterium]|nr:MAG: hypothetical protein JSV78_11440 [Phycisphaerales bacterium]
MLDERDPIFKTLVRGARFATLLLLWVWCSASSDQAEQEPAVEGGSHAEKKTAQEPDGRGALPPEPFEGQELALATGLWDGHSRANRVFDLPKPALRWDPGSRFPAKRPQPETNRLDRLIQQSRCLATDLSVVAPVLRSHAPPSLA